MVTNLLITLLLSYHASKVMALSSIFGQTTRNVATQILQGAGPALVDMNQYNLGSVEEIEQEWTANLVQKAAETETNLRLGCKSDRELFVDTITVSFPRLPEAPGLGIGLIELAGGRQDGLGITVVTGMVEGGSSQLLMDGDSTSILPGDSLASVCVVRRRRKASEGLSETEQEFQVSTECLSYDATVAALQTLPPPDPSKFEDTYRLKLKRIRRKPKVKVVLQYPPDMNEPDASIELFAGENLRYGMLRRGVKLNDPLAKRFDTKNGGNCGANGLCRTCAVSILKGGDLLNAQRPAEKQMLEDSPRWRLSCKAIVGYGMREGEMTVRVMPNQW
jgi:hypothetical protein